MGSASAQKMEPKLAAKKAGMVLEDLLWCASQMQNDPAPFAEALRDKHTREEMTRLVSDLFSLCEVILSEAKPTDPTSLSAAKASKEPEA